MKDVRIEEMDVEVKLPGKLPSFVEKQVRPPIESIRRKCLLAKKCHTPPLE